MEKYKIAAAEALEKLLPDTERLPERREEWDNFYEPDDRRDARESVQVALPTSFPFQLAYREPLAACG